jgi:hypothetical protein
MPTFKTTQRPVLMYRANTPETKTASFKTAKIQNALHSKRIVSKSPVLLYRD